MQGVSPTLSRIKWIGDLYVIMVTSNSMTNPVAGKHTVPAEMSVTNPQECFHMTLRHKTMKCCTMQRFIKKI